ncbi:conjugative transfer ATPase, partial [Arthrobacter stackebrandtii]
MQFISKLLGKGSAMPIEPVLGQTATEHEPIDDRPTTVSTAINEEHRLAANDRYIARLESMGIPSPIDWQNPKRRPATKADVSRMYEVNPSFVDMLPWAEYLPEEEAMLLEDGISRAAFFELVPIGTEGRSDDWLQQARDALQGVLQDSFDELESSHWVVQLYAQDETDWGDYLQKLQAYVQPRADNTDFTRLYLA